MRKSCYSWDDIKMIYEHPHLLGHLCGKTLLTELHSDWMKWGHNSMERRGLMAHRGSYKSTCLTEVGVIYRLLRNPEDLICICRKGHLAALEMIREIMNLMESPPIYELLLFAWFANERGEIPDKAEWHFDVRQSGKLNLSVRKTHTKECNVEGMGLGSNSVGRHYNFLVLDDITGPADRTYQRERENTVVVAAEMISNILNRGMPCLVLGTAWFSSDALALLEEQGMPFRKYPYTVTGLMTEEQVAEARRTQPGPLFDCNYLLEFTSSADMIFSSPVMGEWDKRNVTDIKALVDAAYSPTGDYCALAIAGRLPNNRVCMMVFMEQIHIKDWIPFMLQKLSQYGCHVLYAETNGDHRLALDAIDAHPLARTYGIYTQGYAESQNKQLKISTVLYEAWNHIVWDTKMEPDCMEQILDWSSDTKSNDDVPDACASLLREGKYIVGQNYMALYR